MALTHFVGKLRRRFQSKQSRLYNIERNFDSTEITAQQFAAVQVNLFDVDPYCKYRKSNINQSNVCNLLNIIQVSNFSRCARDDIETKRKNAPG